MTWDVIVAGGGNAALCSAMTAREAGARVLMLESSPEHFRGGNSRHTRNTRYLHENAEHHLTGGYGEEEFWADLMRVTHGETNEDLARFTLKQSVDLGDWMASHGVRWQPPLSGTLHLARTNAFFLGGGKALINAYYETATRLGIEVRYDADVREVRVNGGFKSVVVGDEEIPARAFVAASGGFEANIEWLRKYWGDAADNFIVRGTPYNKGRVLQELLEKGAKKIGKEREFHCVAVDARAPKFDGGIVTRLDCVPFGIVVNREGKRFYDEGEDFWPKRYAIWGGHIARQPGQVAYAIIDSKSMGAFMPSVFPAIEAGSIRELAGKLEIDPEATESAVQGFNQAVRPGDFDASKLDGLATGGLEPPKSNWARAIDTPPYYGYPLRPGITFTYLGVEVDERARVQMESGPASNIFAAGEIMVGNILGRGYLAGFGMTIGSVFGRIAGREAAKHALA